MVFTTYLNRELSNHLFKIRTIIVSFVFQLSYPRLFLTGFSWLIYNSCTFIDHIEELNKESGDSLLMEDNILAICESLALKMLGNANLCLVSIDMPIAPNQDDVSGLRLRFSSEILSSSIPCLITINVEGKCSDPLNLSIKVNCEETVFGLNLLNRIVNFLVEPAHS